MPPLNHTNGDALKAIRTRSGLTLRKLASELEKVGVRVNPNHLTNIEAGRRNAGPELQAALAEVLRVPITAIVTPVVRRDPAA